MIKIITVLAIFLPTFVNAMTTITVYKNDALYSTCSKLCNTVEGCIGQAMSLDRQGGNNGRYKSIVVKHNGKIVLLKNYTTNKGFNVAEEFYQH